MKKILFSLCISITLFTCIIIYLISTTPVFNKDNYKKIYNAEENIFAQYTGSASIPFKYNEGISLFSTDTFNLYGIIPRINRYSIFMDYHGSDVLWKDFTIEIEYLQKDTVKKTQRCIFSCVDPSLLKEICLDRYLYADSLRIKSVSYFVMDPNEILYYSGLIKINKPLISKHAILDVKKKSNNCVSVTNIVINSNTTLFIHKKDGGIISIVHLDENYNNAIKYTDFGVYYYSIISRGI